MEKSERGRIAERLLLRNDQRGSQEAKMLTRPEARLPLCAFRGQPCQGDHGCIVRTQVQRRKDTFPDVRPFIASEPVIECCADPAGNTRV